VKRRNGIARRSFMAGSAALAFARASRMRRAFVGAGELTVAVGPGSSPDVLLRIVAEHLSQLWGQQAIVINQPGGAGRWRSVRSRRTRRTAIRFYNGARFELHRAVELQTNFPVDVVRDFVRSVMSASIRW